MTASHPPAGSPRDHWDGVYRSKRSDQVSWFAPHLQESLRLIRELAPQPSAAILDVGGGESTLVDDLLAAGYRDLAVLDLSPTAIAHTQARLGAAAAGVKWHVGDVLEVPLPPASVDVWHDRAVFHFLTDPAARRAYVARVRRTVRPGGYVVMATFGPEGPLKCSGLDVVRYAPEGLHAEFGPDFRLLGSRLQDHRTPFDTRQQFLYCWCRIDAL